jgi:hypothetical protein
VTDLEISKALALAIGWERLLVSEGKLRLPRNEKQWSWQVFDYRDWNVIGPIAEKYRCFPRMRDGEWIVCVRLGFTVEADTPQKAIALAVIQGAKK